MIETCMLTQGNPLTLPNITMLFNNGYNPSAGANDDQAVVFVQDVRADGSDPNAANPLINGEWEALDNKANVGNPDAVINRIKNGPFKMWLPRKGGSGTWRLWFYYLDDPMSWQHHVIGLYEIDWCYKDGKLHISPTRGISRGGDGFIDPGNLGKKIFDFVAWRARPSWVKRTNWSVSEHGGKFEGGEIDISECPTR